MIRKAIVILAILLFPASVWAQNECGVSGDICYINTDTCAYYGDGDTNTCATSNGGEGYYRSLAEWDTYEATDISGFSEPMYVYLMDGSEDNADTTVTDMSGWTVGSDDGLYITTPPGERGSQWGKFDSSIYYFHNTSANHVIIDRENYTVIDHIQIKHVPIGSGDYAALINSGQTTGTLNYKNMVVEVDGSNNTGFTYVIKMADTSTVVVVESIIGYGADICISIDGAASLTGIYNSTFSDCSLVGLTESATGTFYSYNNITNATNDNWNNTWVGDYNACDDSCGDAPGSNSVTSFTETTEFVDPNGSPPDFRLKDTASDLRDCGSTTGGTGCNDPSSSGYGDPDITGATRGREWDIGADEAPDVNYVNTDTCSYDGDGSSNTCASATGGRGYYRTLDAFESTENADISSLAEPLIVYVSDGTENNADTIGVIFNGWTTGSDDGIHIISADYHGGKWNTSAYRMEVVESSYVHAISFREQYGLMDGLQAEMTCDGTANKRTLWAYGIAFGGSEIIWTNNIVTDDSTDVACGGSTFYGIDTYDSDGTYIVAGNIIYEGPGSHLSAGLRGTELTKFMHNTVNCDYRGILGVSTTILYGNAIMGASAGNSMSTGVLGDYNATEINDESNPGSNGVDTFTPADEFVDPTGSPPDFRLKDTASALRDCGSTTGGTGCNDLGGSGYGSPDITGAIRGREWDLGADEAPDVNYVNTDCSSYKGDGSSSSCASATGGKGAYRTFTEWEGDEDRVLTSDTSVYFSGATDDTNYATISGWTNGSYTMTLQPDVGWGHSGVLDTDKYFRIRTDLPVFTNNEDGVIVDGLQFYSTCVDEGYSDVIQLNGTNTGTVFKNNIVVADFTDAGCTDDASVTVESDDVLDILENNLVYLVGASPSGGAYQVVITYGKAYHNTVHIPTGHGTTGDCYIEVGTAAEAWGNVCINESTNSDCFAGTWADGDYNACLAADTEMPGSNNVTSYTPADEFTDYTASPPDFSLDTTAADLIDCGDDSTGCSDISTDGYGDPDILLVDRDTKWDLGAFEYVSGEAPELIIFFIF